MYDFSFGELRSDNWQHYVKPPWLIRKFRKTKPMFPKVIADLKTWGS